MTPQQLRAMAEAVAARYPDATLVKNQVGNLAILLDGEVAGFLNLRSGEVNWDDSDEEGSAS